MKPLLAHIYEPHRVDYSNGVWLQDKLNGVRALSQGGFFQSRDELPWPKDMLKHLSDYMVQMFPAHWILDGELYVHGWKLQDINKAVAVNATVRGANKMTPLVEYHIFDCVNYHLPFEARYVSMVNIKRGMTNPDIPIKFVRTIKVYNEWDANDFYATAISKNYEGIMYRIGKCPYTIPKQEGQNGRRRFLSDKNNRVWHMLKRKDWRDDEFTCVRVEEGEGKRSSMVGAFICETPGGHYFGVGSGLTESEAIYYYENPPIGRKIKVKYLCLTSDGIPFNPTVIAVL
jgi:ATP-dependent DNA ligase